MTAKVFRVLFRRLVPMDQFHFRLKILLDQFPFGLKIFLGQFQFYPTGQLETSNITSHKESREFDFESSGSWL